MMYNGYIVIKCFAIVWAAHGILGILQTALSLTRGGEETKTLTFKLFLFLRPSSSRSEKKQIN